MNLLRVLRRLLFGLFGLLLLAVLAVGLSLPPLVALAGVFQLATLLLLGSLAGNLLSILVPFRVEPGTMKPLQSTFNGSGEPEGQEPSAPNCTRSSLVVGPTGMLPLTATVAPRTCAWIVDEQLSAPQPLGPREGRCTSRAS